MRDGGTVVFVEVRYRRRSDYGDGAESIDPRKRARIVATAQRYLQAHPPAAARPCRFDVVSVSAQGGAQAIRWIPDAFQS
jgi:putative endonuclease